MPHDEPTSRPQRAGEGGADRPRTDLSPKKIPYDDDYFGSGEEEGVVRERQAGEDDEHHPVRERQPGEDDEHRPA